VLETPKRGTVELLVDKPPTQEQRSGGRGEIHHKRREREEQWGAKSSYGNKTRRGRCRFGSGVIQEKKEGKDS